MRKVYTRPLLFAESFELSEHIAGCAYMASFGNDCQLTVDGVSFFTESAGCQPDGDGMILLQGVMDDPTGTPTLQDFYKLNMKCYNSFVDFTTGDLFTS